MKRIVLFIFLLTCQTLVAVRAQVIPAEASQVKVDNLTDEQVRQIVEEMKKNRIRLQQIGGFASQKGIPASEVAKLRARIQALNLEKELDYQPPQESHQTGRGIDMEAMSNEVAGVKSAINNGKRIYGSELFNNRNLTFEPNLKMPTPPNYRLATGDEIIIDVYGYAEVQHTLKVSPEGYVRVPFLGPVYVNGLTMEEAKNRLTKQLATIYGGIKSGNTFVQVSLGTIRSITVLLIGEVERPGSYTLPSLASIANALYVSGGPSENGSFRDIQVIRSGSVIVTFDLYDFLSRGELTNNIILQEQDIVKVNPYKTRVELDGQVKRPAIFEAKEGETLGKIIEYAGGYTDRSYREVIRASRINNKEREIISVSEAEIPNFTIKSGDHYFVDAILDRFSNRVSITGAVFHPGDYQLESGMTLTDLIKKADGLMEVASLSRGIIRRMKEDYTPLLINFNVNDVMEGKQNITLIREDSVVIFSKLQLQEKHKIKIDGLVNNPGYFDFADSMKLEDLILIAGGLRDAASLKRVEISRRLRGTGYTPGDTTVAIVLQFDIREDLRSAPDASAFQLQPFDEVLIRKSPNYHEQSSVSIEGAIIYPGTYVIQSTRERISDLLKRAGGLNADAFPQGAVLMRKTFANSSDSALFSFKTDIYASKMADTNDIARFMGGISRKQQLVGINLEQIIKSPGSRYDLFLEEGDAVKVPRKLQTIQIFGEVYFPKKVRFDRNSKFRDYIRNSGGFTNNALKRKSYVVHANGEVKGTKKVFFFNSYPKLKPGSEIYIPKKGDRKGVSGQEIIGYTTGIASLALIIFTILDRTKSN